MMRNKDNNDDDSKYYYSNDYKGGGQDEDGFQPLVSGGGHGLLDGEGETLTQHLYCI